MDTKMLQRFTLFVLLCGLFCVVSAEAQYFRVTLNGFRADKLTNEGFLITDAEGDEVVLRTDVAMISSSDNNLPSWRHFPPISQSRLDRDLHRCFPEILVLCTQARLPAPVSNGNPLPVKLFEGYLGRDETVVIIPTIWEMDNIFDQDLLGKYNFKIDNNPELLATAKSMLLNPPPLQLNKFLFSDFATGLSNTVLIAGYTAQDRPIGMKATGAINQFGFAPQVLFLTSQAADFISRGSFGYGIGVVPINYREDSFMGGDYTLFLQVSPCPANFISVFTGTVEMTTTNNNYGHGSITATPPTPPTQPISMAVYFSDCQTKIRIANFAPVVFTPFEVSLPGESPIPNVTATISRANSGNGTYNPSDGSLEIPISFLFQHSATRNYFLNIPSSLSLTLSTLREGVEKNRVTGRIVLMGSGTFRNGFLDNSTGTIKITGSFWPRPTNIS